MGVPLRILERQIIEAAIAHCGGSIPRAAGMLEVSPSTIYRRRKAGTSRTPRRACPNASTEALPARTPGAGSMRRIDAVVPDPLAGVRMSENVVAR